ncbi:hypothetical protein [uncultured Tateyamaria sp.]|uniref:hypothetical protein n=1 Tax=Tateyamaria sp. 1078 TaxID=3417464 RepID=UPI0026350251|nr:hypothetical protein [uncultured Tateyamaria sp.]
MSSEPENPVLKKVESLAERFGLMATTICGRAFKDSKKLGQLRRRSDRESEELERLDELETQLLLEEQKRARVAAE